MQFAYGCRHLHQTAIQSSIPSTPIDRGDVHAKEADRHHHCGAQTGFRDRGMTVRAACILMAENHVGALVVVESGRIAGIFTERDALNKVLAGGLDPDATTLEAVMVANP